MSAQKSNTSESGSQNSPNPPEHRDPDIVREISLEEFKPKGTLTLTLLYFAIVAIMWVFMYFVEFANHGPSIID